MGEGGFWRTAEPADGELGGGFFVGVPDPEAPVLSLDETVGRRLGGEMGTPADVVVVGCSLLLFGSLLRWRVGVDMDPADCEGVMNDGQPPPPPPLVVRVRDDVPDVDASIGVVAASLLFRPKLSPVLLVRRLNAPRSSLTT